MYGIYNTVKKEFQFGICEPTARKAIDALFLKIGKDAYKWRFEAKKLPRNTHDLDELRKELTELLEEHLAKEVGPTIYDRAYDVGKKDTLQVLIRRVDAMIRDRRK